MRTLDEQIAHTMTSLVTKPPLRPAAWQDPTEVRSVMCHHDRTGRFRNVATHLTTPLFTAEDLATIADDQATECENACNWAGGSAAREIARLLREAGGRRYDR